MVNKAWSTQQMRCASQQMKKSSKKGETKKKRKANTDYVQHDLSKAEQFSLCDAMRYVVLALPVQGPRPLVLMSLDELSYIRAFEVGYPPTSAKYDLAVRLRTPKNGPVVRNRIRLPHPVKTDLRICVICPPDSPHAAAAKKAGAAVVGEDTVFDAVKAGRIEFDRCVCHSDSLQKLSKAGIARMLGPKGLMPSAKFGTVVRDVAASVKELVGASEYREREAVLRLSIGQLGFSPEELQKNIKSFMAQIKRELGALSDRVTKEVHEVVLSSTRSPGFSLNGNFRSLDSVTTTELSTL
ncbi:MAG: mitochondrial 54S ribosomal protein mrpl1 [Lichina confinis]|nr:MAG: mitochondrial 54S ribosomal protein mrpl1 [Lichina confinis]